MEGMCFWQIVSMALALTLIVGCVVLAKAASVIKEQTEWINDLFNAYTELANEVLEKEGNSNDTGNN